VPPEALHDDLPLPAGAALPPFALHDDLLPPAALQEALPLLAGAALPPFALQEALLPAADGSVAPGAAELPPPQAAVAPISTPATADTARAFAMFMSVSSLLLEKLFVCNGARGAGSSQLRARD
jgi:hypothetical protein